MRLHSVYFEHGSPHYGRLARALKLSVSDNSPRTPIVIDNVAEPDIDITTYARPQNIIDNVRKTRHHLRVIQQANDGELICLIDADTLVLRDLSEVERYEFDIAYTVKPPGSAYYFNSGVIFVRVSDRTREFYQRWWEVCHSMLCYPVLHLQWKTRYGGINQSSFGYLLNAGHDLKLIELPCAEWNSIRETWPEYGPATRIVHILAKLRDACFFPTRHLSNVPIITLRNIWREYDQRAQKMA